MSICLVGILLGGLAVPAAHPAVVERIDVRKWGTAIVVGVSSPQGRLVVSYGTLSPQDDHLVVQMTVRVAEETPQR